VSARYHLGKILEHAGAIAGFGPEARRSRPGPFDAFLSEDASAINRARQEHLASLGLEIGGKTVLEVGAGIGLHTPFFLDRGCSVVVTDGNPQNVAEIRRRHPRLRVECVDLDGAADLAALGSFDIVYCYGLLYHLADPDRALKRMAAACRGMLLLETCVSLGKSSEVTFLRDFRSNNQATTGVGCRPTRPWIMDRLKQYFGHAYHSVTQPDHPDFPVDWEMPETRLLYRAVFVGSRQPLTLPALSAEIPRRQARHSDPRT
jgi:SAM-dependent methyltransferase